MAQIPGERVLIQQEETAYRASVSEATLTRVGATANFINLYQANMREFMINGEYSGLLFTVDGIVRFPFNWELIDCYIYSGISTGTSGTTTLDIKWKPFSSGSYSSIFSVLPAFNAGSSGGQTCGQGQSVSGFTAPVLSKTQFDAYDQLRLDLINSVVGGISCGIGITFRPR